MPTTVPSVTTRIYNGLLDPSTVNRTDEMENVTAIYMVAPDTTLEYEVDFYLQFQVDGTTNRLVRLNETFTLDTVTVFPIPIELQGLGIPFYGVMLSSTAVAVEVWAISREGGLGGDANCDLESIENSLTVVEGQLLEMRLFLEAMKMRDFALYASVGNIAVGLGVLSASLSVVTGTTSNAALPPFGTAAALMGVSSGGALLL